MFADDLVQKNKAKLFLYMALMTAVIGILGYFISNYFGYGMSGFGMFLIFSGILNFVAYFFSDTIVIKSTKAKFINEEEMPRYYALVREMCERNNLKMPRLYIIDSMAMNAFATGRNRDKSVVAVTRGLLERLTPEEISGVVGHELSHIENGDMLLMSALAILVGIISILSDMFRYNALMNRFRERDNSGIMMLVGIILSLIAPLTAFLIKLAVSRTREYSADAKGAQICGNPLFLASALNKIM